MLVYAQQNQNQPQRSMDLEVNAIQQQQNLLFFPFFDFLSFRPFYRKLGEKRI